MSTAQQTDGVTTPQSQLTSTTCGNLVGPGTQDDLVSKYSSPTIQVVVGMPPRQIIFTIHKDLITAASKFFKAAFRWSFAEAQSNTINLPDEDAGLFAIVVEAAYAGSIISENPVYRTLSVLDDLKLYTILDKYDFLDRDGLSMAKHHLHEMCDSLVAWDDEYGPQHISYIFEHSTNGSPLRSLAAHAVAQRIELGPELSQDFVACIQEFPDLAATVMLWLGLRARRAKYLEKEHGKELREDL